jgi:hypothetical protein
MKEDGRIARATQTVARMVQPDKLAYARIGTQECEGLKDSGEADIFF